MWHKVTIITCGLLALGGISLGQELTRFRVVGGEAVVGLAAEIPVLIADAPAGVKAVEGALTLTGAQGHIAGLHSEYGVQVVAQTARTVRFRWLDLADQVGRRARDVELLTVSVVAEEAGEIQISLTISFLATDTSAPSVAEVKGEPVRVRALAVGKGNEPPRACDDAVQTTEGVPVTIPVLANDSDPAGRLDPATVAIVSGPENGSIVVRADGTLIYTPDEGFVGTDAFTYTVQDDEGVVSNTATVTVLVEAGGAPSLDGQGRPSIRMEGGEWTAGDVVWVEVGLALGPGGVRRLEFELLVTDSNLVNVEALALEGVATGTWEMDERDPGRWRVRLADLFDQIQPGAEELRARIQLRLSRVGTAELVVRSAHGVDDDGEPFTLPDRTIAVAAVLGPLEPGGARPQDLDGDGLFEDLDGDGRLTLRDALLLAFYYDRPPLSLVPAVVDFNGDGVLCFADAQALAQLVMSREGEGP